MATSLYFASRLRAERQRQGLTLRQVAMASGLSVSQVSRLERGHRRPDWDQLVRLSRALRVPAGEWFPDPVAAHPRAAEAAAAYAPHPALSELWDYARQYLLEDDWEDVRALIESKVRRRRPPPREGN